MKQIKIDDNFVLQKIKLSDVDDIFNIYSNAELLKFTDSNLLKTKKEATSRIKYFTKSYKHNSHFYFGISNTETNKIIGIISLHDVNLKHSFAFISCILIPEFRKKGIMNQAISNIVEFGFNVLNLNRIEAQVFEKNYASISMLERANFKFEGKLRQNFLIDGKFENSVVYSFIKEDL
jgi:ribosomal-protein-alanine N-acetyltransferase